MNRVQLGFATNAFTASCYTNFNLSTGTVGFQAAQCKASITSIGNGWYRCAITAEATTTMTNQLGCYISLILTDTEARALGTRLGVATNNILGWGFQIEKAASAGAYLTTTATLRSRVYFDVAPSIPTMGVYNLSVLNSSGTLETRPLS